jgi:hypothetical protein
VEPTDNGETNSPSMISTQPQPSPMARPRLAYSLSELASLLGLSTRSLQRLEDRGSIRSSKALRKKIYPHHEGYEVPRQRWLTRTATDAEEGSSSAGGDPRGHRVRMSLNSTSPSK